MTSNYVLAENRVAMAQKLFEHYDANASEFIDAHELLRLCQAMDPGVTTQGVETSIQEVGARGGLDAASFSRWVQSMFGEESDEEYFTGLEELLAIPVPPTPNAPVSPEKLGLWKDRAGTAERQVRASGEELDRGRREAERSKRRIADLEELQAVHEASRETMSLASGAGQDGEVRAMLEKEMSAQRQLLRCTPTPNPAHVANPACLPACIPPCLPAWLTHAWLTHASPTRREYAAKQMLDLNMRLVESQNEAQAASQRANQESRYIVILHDFYSIFTFFVRKCEKLVNFTC